MALSDQWTQAQLNATVRRELMDPTGTTSWSWNDIEINQYITDWQNFLQDRFEFVWGSSTFLTTGTNTLVVGTLTNTGYGTATFALSGIAGNILRPGNMWWNGYRLVGRDKDELEIMERDWRAVQPGVPQAVYQDDATSISVWPPPAAGTAVNTLVMEYPAILSFTTNTSPTQIPAWTKYSCVNYCGYRAYIRPGPQQDLQRAARYKAKFVKQGVRFRDMWDQYLPDKAPSIRPVTDNGDRYMGDTLNVGMHNTLFQTWF